MTVTVQQNEDADSADESSYDRLTPNHDEPQLLSHEPRHRLIDRDQSKIAGYSPSGFALVAITLGVGSVFAWTVFASIYQHWILDFGPFKNLRLTWTIWYVLTAKTVNVIGTTTNILLTQRCSAGRRVYLSYAGVICLLLASALLTKMDIKTWTIGLGIVFVFFGMLMEMCLAFLNATGTLFGSHPRIYINYFLQGQSISGIIVAMLTIVTPVIRPVTANAWFEVQEAVTISAAVLIFCLCIFLYRRVSRVNIVNWSPYQRRKASKRARLGEVISETRSQLSGLKIYMATAFLVSWGTSSIFPMVIELAESACKHPETASFSYNPEGFYCRYFKGTTYSHGLVFLVFYNGSWFGTLFAGCFNRIPTQRPRMYLICALFRINIIAAFLFMRRADFAGIGLMCDDIGFMGMVLWFGMSNGYLQGSLFDNALKIVNPQDTDVVIAALLACRQVGVLVGIGSSFGLLQLIRFIDGSQRLPDAILRDELMM